MNGAKKEKHVEKEQEKECAGVGVVRQASKFESCGF